MRASLVIVSHCDIILPKIYGKTVESGGIRSGIFHPFVATRAKGGFNCLPKPIQRSPEKGRINEPTRACPQAIDLTVVPHNWRIDVRTEKRSHIGPLGHNLC